LTHRPPVYRWIARAFVGAGAVGSLAHFFTTRSTLLPAARIPIQFSLFGKPSWSASREFFAMYPALSIGVPSILLLAPSLPDKKKRSPEKHEKVHSMVTNLTNDLAIILSIALPGIQYYAAETAQGHVEGLPPLVAQGLVAVVVGVAALYTYALYKVDHGSDAKETAKKSS